MCIQGLFSVCKATRDVGLESVLGFEREVEDVRPTLSVSDLVKYLATKDGVCRRKLWDKRELKEAEFSSLASGIIQRTLGAYDIGSG